MVFAIKSIKRMLLVSIMYQMTIDQNTDLKIFYIEYVMEELLEPFKNHSDVKKIYPIQVIDLRIQVDHSNIKKIQLHEEYRPAINIGGIFMTFIRQKETKVISDGKNY